jgi:hypothetical protein
MQCQKELPVRLLCTFDHREDILDGGHRIIPGIRQVQDRRARAEAVHWAALPALPVRRRSVAAQSGVDLRRVTRGHRQRGDPRHVVGVHRLLHTHALAPFGRRPHRRRRVAHAPEQAAHLHAGRRQPPGVGEPRLPRGAAVLQRIGVHHRGRGTRHARVVHDVLAVDPPVPRDRHLARDVDAAGGEVGEVLLAAVVGVHGLGGHRTGGGVGVERRHDLRRGRRVGVVRVRLLRQGEARGGGAAGDGEGERALDRVGEEDGVGRDVRRDGEGREGVADVGGGERVGPGARDVGVKRERPEVERRGIVGGEGEEQAAIVRRWCGVDDEEEQREGGSEGGEGGGDDADEPARGGRFVRRRQRGREEEGGGVEARHGARRGVVRAGIARRKEEEQSAGCSVLARLLPCRGRAVSGSRAV